MARREFSEAPLSPAVLQALVEGTSTEVGEEFFAVLVERLAQALGTSGAWVTEWLPASRRLRALAFWLEGAPFGEYEYAITGTVCEVVIEKLELVHVPDHVFDQYPGDPDLKALGAVSYIGVPLLDTGGEILGHLAVLDTKPLPPEPRVEAVFRIFAGRAAAELRRVRRDRDLRQREEKLRNLVGNALDAIVELDGALAVLGLNPSAERTFARPGELVRGRPVTELLDAASSARLVHLASQLRELPPEQRSLWIPEGLVGARADGSRFPAEATLSGFEVLGRTHFALILRNVDERLAASARIDELVREAAVLREELAALEGFDEIVGESPALRAALADVERVAASDATVLITGETGTGKELFARALHRKSRRAKKPLVKVNCAAIAPSLQESEFFGHVRGAFTGATQDREGRFALADGGTIFLDEVGDMPKDLQAKLLRVLQEGEFEPVGGSRTRRVDVRVIAATNRSLEAMVAEGSFRADLYYRLAVIPIAVPPLRERGRDVSLLARAFAADLARRAGRAAPILTGDDEARLARYDWPGNVRELANVVERAFLTSRDPRRLDLRRALPDPAGPSVSAVPAEDGARVLSATELRDFERANLERALLLAGGKVSGPGGVAERLGLPATTITSRMRALGIARHR